MTLPCYSSLGKKPEIDCSSYKPVSTLLAHHNVIYLQLSGKPRNRLVGMKE